MPMISTFHEVTACNSSVVSLALALSRAAAISTVAERSPIPISVLTTLLEDLQGFGNGEPAERSLTAKSSPDSFAGMGGTHRKRLRLLSYR
ncbi:hypothetical protein FA13DRAFT_1414327 [Coprinellus micaceus]|uniref:Uncharacterized protein n=1 Tax=Coprinellus micaceus TaxID=71717 RepID=A0A4Y7SNK0_COPMI|nr:hypothetical protein FA13DRAFT_1414327 [Coprinellus micaceus]